MSAVSGVLALMGSGETSPTMVTPHRRLAARLGPAPSAVILETPYGFQVNTPDISRRAREYFERSVGLATIVAEEPDPSDGPACARLADQLREAMRSRAVIEQTKGVIMATARCDAEAAFDLMVKQSQHENRKLREIADELVRRQGPGEPAEAAR